MIVTKINGRYRHNESWVVVMIICCWPSVSLVVYSPQFKFSKKRNETNIHLVSTACISLHFFRFVWLISNGPITLSSTSVPFNFYMMLIGIENMSLRQCQLIKLYMFNWNQNSSALQYFCGPHCNCWINLCIQATWAGRKKANLLRFS